MNLDQQLIYLPVYLGVTVIFLTSNKDKCDFKIIKGRMVNTIISTYN